MDISEVVSARKFREFNAQQKQELYETLLQLAQAIEEIPKKSLRKTLEVSLAVLQYKGEQLRKVQTQLDSKESSEDDSRNERLRDENEKLKRMLEKLEDEKLDLKQKVKELTDEVFQLQKRIQEAAHTAANEGSDKDSSDPLSELDKQEELLRNINSKNKHIKRLLREIESLQNQNIEQSKTIITSENELQECKAKLLQLSADITLVDSERKALKDTVNELNIEITRLEGNITYLEEEREKSERVLKDFIEKLEVKAQSWKSKLDEKDKELRRLRIRLEETGDEPQSYAESIDKGDGDTFKGDENTLQETTKLLHAIESRDKHIEALELKIKSMAEEMISSTELMNKLSSAKEDERNPQKLRACCKTIEKSLQAANERCRELSEMLERAEEDNVLKSKQAMQAIAALEAYQRGDDGLVKALRKCSTLEQKVISRDKQIQALIMELNSMHEIAHENGILRKRLNIPDDMIITARNLAAKERNKDKIIERLTLKLRASEEMRLQLKLDKSDLRKELLELRGQSQVAPQPVQTEKTAMDSLRLPSEVGEVEDSMRVSGATLEGRNFCTNCKLSLDIPDESNQAFAELQVKYQEVLEENETLRLGMHEILEKLREYDASSDHITIDTEMLYRLLGALRSRSAPDTPKRLHAELQSLKAREEALSALLKQQPLQPASDINDTSDELNSVESMREDGELRQVQEDLALQLPPIVDSSTRPTTPNKSLNQSSIPIIADSESHCIERVHELEQQVGELKIYRLHYTQLQQELAASEVELIRHCAELTQQVTNLDLELNKQRASYAFMREDYDRTLNESKQNALQHMEEVAELKRQLGEHKQVVFRLEAEQERQRNVGNYSKDEYLVLQKANAELRTQLAFIIEQLLTGQAGVELQVQDICTDYGLIKENLQLDYITEQEWEQQHAELKAVNEKNVELQRKALQLEGLLEVAQEQIQSQQKLLNEITDNHINLRHLVADLQSTTEDKLLLAKMQRDAENVKYELENVRLEREELKQKCISMQAELNAKEQQSAQQLKDFQNERSNKDIKIKFLQKSLFALKEKYTKFTPLIFLTNFVFAYTKFVKKTMKADENGKHSDVIDKMQEWVTVKLEEYTISNDESQHLIKLIKTETQCRLLEEQLSELQKRYEVVQAELLEQRVRHASESEHWQTIEALFRPETVSKVEAPIKETTAVYSMQPVPLSNVELQDVATNTEVPMPAERKLSTIAPARRKSLTQMVDKNMSPIGSPIRRIRKADVGVQTLPEEVEAIKEKDDHSKNVEQAKPENEEMQRAQGVEKCEIDAVDKISERPESATSFVAKKRTTEALVQTISGVCASQSVQTEALETVDPPLAAAGELTKHLEQELQEALQKANERARLLEQSQTDLSIANKRIEELQKLLDKEGDDLPSSTKSTPTIRQQNEAELSQHSGIIEKTIISFHTLLSEKDKSISKYQDLLQTEREQMQSSTAKLLADIEGLKNTIVNLNFNIKTKDLEIMELKSKLESVTVRRNSNEKLDLAMSVIGADDSGDNSLNELTDEKIEEMFQHDGASALDVNMPAVTVVEHEEKQDTEALKEIPMLQQQIIELKDKFSYAEKTLKVKEDELMLLKEKLHLYQEREKSLETVVNPEIEQLRLLLEEKDKHINELTETLNNFHDDQQRYIKDSSNYSADQISKLAADLTRIEATNKIYQTQVDALRRQVASLTQREKQARELNQSLRNQLIKRPVVSIKTELNARVKHENLQKRIQSLELELEEARAQIHRQHLLLEAKRAKSASEVGMWEKQKRWQQNAEKYKAKYEESESTLEKTRTLLQSARTMISRLEKEKQVLEVKLGRATHGAGVAHNMKCCRTPSCPNLHGKYTPSESPETYTGGSSECSSPARSASGTHTHYYCGTANAASVAVGKQQHQGELIEALKARIELQQRKILAMELEGKGTNALTTEMEKLQEKLSEVEAQNIRLEAKNLQLQLDNDLLRQGDATERLQKRIKYLEDYIIALKEEMAQAEARRELCKCSGIKLNTHLGQSAAQTILSLRGIVEKLRAENKFLKDGRRSCESRSSSEAPPAELGKLQKMYAESLDKISALQIELNLKAKCTKCGSRGKLETHVNDELAVIKEQLSKKTQLLQKAKVLLTRAAAKEKVLKEQLAMWKRKCSELQNVPVIDEISE